MSDPLRFISEPCAVVGGYTAHVLGSALRGLARQGAFDRMAPHQRAELIRTINAIEHAGGVWRARRGAETGTTTPLPASAGALSSHRQFSTTEAADLLGIRPRQARKLGAAGLARRVGGRWVFDADSVHAERERRRAA